MTVGQTARRCLFLVFAMAIYTAGFAAPKYWDTYEVGQRAYDAKNYPVAFSVWKDFYDRHKGKTYLAELAAGHIADMYFYGNGMAPDFPEAAKWYLRASKRPENFFSSGTLGFMYYVGLGVTQNYAEAAKWLEKDAMTFTGGTSAGLLGTMYRDGVGVSRNDALAARWFKRAQGRTIEDWSSKVNRFRELGAAAKISADEVMRIHAGGHISTSVANAGGLNIAANSQGVMLGSSAATANSGRAANAGGRDLSGPELEQLCAKNLCSPQLNECRRAGAQAPCYIASACVRQCFAANAPNDPHRAEWLQAAAQDLNNARALQSDVPTFNFGKRQPSPSAPPPASSAPTPPTPCEGAGSGGRCAGAAR